MNIFLAFLEQGLQNVISHELITVAKKFSLFLQDLRRRIQYCCLKSLPKEAQSSGDGITEIIFQVYLTEIHSS